MIKSRIRFFIGYFISLYLISTGKVLNIVNRALNGEIILSIYFHNPSKETFKFLIQWLQKKGFQFISAEDLIKVLKGQKKFPKGAVFMSIDDGWRKNISNVFEMVSQPKIPITLFATIEPIVNNTGFWWSYIDMAIKKGFKIQKKEILKSINNRERIKIVENLTHSITIQDEAISLLNLKELKNEKNITIGSHTFSHPILKCCNENDMKFEIGESKKRLEKLLNNTIKYFAYPNGIHSERETDCVKSNGYEAGFGTDPDYIMKDSNINIYNIPRFEISDDVSLNENICRLTGVWYSLNLSKRDNA
jgi:peptidoglycan/xylan/chitin deacetylase (PgdA/CDA1 family)